MIIISSCLIGLNSKYNGENNYDKNFLDILKEEIIIPFCPEQAGGLPTPRSPAEISGGDGFDVLKGIARVVTKDGVDVTENYIKGAYEALKLAKIYGITKAILKSKSPSCGCGEIYDGSFKNKIKDGTGVTAALFLENGIQVISSEEFLKGKNKTKK
ncbi:DUF523 domain-containing protein [Thermovenabulum gondwanense]|uniref:Uncharacterized protein n=1 Tax=Thermovenabulum gondwanense TaxID=520767 RepID=A0A162MC22_9FIRM|nr:DUF523 domain-containing protein [Thermovenabulum gondwanense]KYO65220.1 hypothetical protein ATZ99_16620 [Thermovenabulum gondwanense]